MSHTDWLDRWVAAVPGRRVEQWNSVNLKLHVFEMRNEVRAVLCERANSDVRKARAAAAAWCEENLRS